MPADTALSLRERKKLRTRTELAAAMTARPANEPVAVALRHALLAFADTLDQDRDLVLAKSRISVEVPSLRARSLESQVQWEDAIARAIAVLTLAGASKLTSP